LARRVAKQARAGDFDNFNRCRKPGETMPGKLGRGERARCRCLTQQRYKSAAKRGVSS
jgi:hypothetical protein